MDISRRRIDEIVTAVAEALGVGAGVINASKFDACVKEVREVMREGKKDATLGRDILQLMVDGERARLMGWGRGSVIGHVQSAASEFLADRAKMAKTLYDRAKAIFDAAHEREKKRHALLTKALTPVKAIAANADDADTVLLIEEILEQGAVG